jgi:hypothetical protein
MAYRAARSSGKRLLNLFMCHASADKEEVRALCNLLASDGAQPWLDEWDILPGQDWELEIQKALRAADIVIVCLSSRSVSKEGYVQKEIALAIEVSHEKPEGTIFLVPVRLDDCVVPHRLKRWQWVDFFSNGGYAKLIASCTHRAEQLGLALRKSSPGQVNQPAGQVFLVPHHGSRESSIFRVESGDRVRFVEGPLAGAEGIVKTLKGKRVIVDVRLLERVVIVEADTSWVVPF